MRADVLGLKEDTDVPEKRLISTREQRIFSSLQPPFERILEHEGWG
jgi:hypothetical protein